MQKTLTLLKYIYCQFHHALAQWPHLHLADNNFSLFYLQIGSCTRLTVLSLRDNWLSRLPSEIGNCKNLHVFDVSGNRYSKSDSCSVLQQCQFEITIIIVLWLLFLLFLTCTMYLLPFPNRLECLPLSVGTLPLKALWLSENQVNE